jgi:hypothetical protein
MLGARDFFATGSGSCATRSNLIVVHVHKGERLLIMHTSATLATAPPLVFRLGRREQQFSYVAVRFFLNTSADLPSTPGVESAKSSTDPR